MVYYTGSLQKKKKRQEHLYYVQYLMSSCVVDRAFDSGHFV